MNRWESLRAVRGTTTPPIAYDCMTSPLRPIVLIVDDECLIRSLAVEVFLEDGFLVLEAEHAAEALLVHAAGGPVHVLFTDINMPGKMNGIDLAEHLKTLSPELCVILASGLPVLRPIDHVPATFVAKPYDIHAVCATARELLAA